MFSIFVTIFSSSARAHPEPEDGDDDWLIDPGTRMSGALIESEPVIVHSLDRDRPDPIATIASTPLRPDRSVDRVDGAV